MSEDERFDAFTDAGLIESGDGWWLDASDAVGGIETEAGVFLGWVDVAWLGPHTPVRQLRDVVHLPRASWGEVREAVEHAEMLREAALRPCRYCGERNIPGHMHSKDVCQSCAERHLGVVH
jgi:NADH pyrophosphatase NudC (nudix superfamily)